MTESTARWLLEALRDLVAADNCNYSREAMRYEGLFDAARRAVRAADRELGRKGAEA